MGELAQYMEHLFPTKPALYKGKLMGVWVNGILKLKSRNKDKIYAAAEQWMREHNNVWVAPVGSFVV